MKTTTPKKPFPKPMKTPLSDQPVEDFPSSPALAESLRALKHEQNEIDRAEAERLARLREIQSLD